MANFAIGELTPTVPPIIQATMLKFGEDYRGQAGTEYQTANAKKMALTIDFPRLTKTEFALLKSYAFELPSGLKSVLTMQDCDDLYDGVTVNTILGRPLNRVSIKTFSEGRQMPYDEDGVTTIFNAGITVEEV